MPAAARPLFFGYTLTHSRIINLAELSHYIMEYGLTITTPGQMHLQFVFFSLLSLSLCLCEHP